MESWLIQISNYLFTHSWQIAVLTITVALASILLRNRSAHVRYLLWLIVLAKILVPPLYSIPVAVLPQQSLTMYANAPSIDERVVTEHGAPEAAAAESAKPTLIQSRAAAPRTIDRVAKYDAHAWLAIGWFAGTVVLSFYYLLNALRTQVWLLKRRMTLSGKSANSIESFFTSHGVKYKPRVWLLDRINQPFVWGLVRGSIYLPARLLDGKDANIQSSLLGHELSHVVRLDAMVNSLQVIAQTVFWFHPFVWWANTKIRDEREKCCDEMTIARLNTLPEEYGGAIVETLAAKYKQARPIPSLAVAGQVKNIEERIKNMLRPGKKFYKRPSLIALIIILLFAFLIVPIGCVLTNKSETKTVTEQKENTSKSLFEAIWASDPDEVKRLIANGLDVNTTDPDNPDVKYTPLMAAANGGFAKVAKVLLENGAEVNSTDFQGWTALYYAYWLYSSDDNEKKHRERAELVKALIKSGADVNKQCQGISPLINAITTGTRRLGSIEALLDGGADLHFKDKRGLTPLYYAAFDGDRNVLDLIIERGDYADTIHLAACRGDLDKVQTLLEKGMDVNTKDEFGCTPLHWAARARSPEVAGLLIANGADINATAGPDNLTPFMAARKLPVIELLVSKGVDINSQENLSKLHDACSAGDIQVVRFLIDKGADINARNGRGATPLWAAASGDQKEVVELLLGEGADINAPGRRGSTPVGIAARNGNKATLELLIKKGANIHTPDNRGMTPLDLAKQWGWNKVVEMLQQHGAKRGSSTLLGAVTSSDIEQVKSLLSQGADINAKNNAGQSLLHLTCQRGNKEIAELLIDNGADIEAKNRKHQTPLHVACQRGNKEIVELLIENNANIGHTPDERYGSTALHIVAVSGHKEIVELLLDKGADIEAKNSDGGSPLGLIAGYGSVYNSDPQGQHEIIGLLIGKGADIETRSYWDNTPLSVAILENRPEVAELLLKHGAKLNVISKFLGTIAHCAMRVNLPEMVRWSIEKGVDIPPLHQAAYFGDIDKVKSLLSEGANVNQKDVAEFTALHCASLGQNVEIAQLLIDKGADIEARHCGYRTALYDVCNLGYLKMVKLLVVNGADVKTTGNHRDEFSSDGVADDWTPLHVAASPGHAEVTEYLLTKGADIQAKCTRLGHEGLTALHLAARHGRLNVVEVLLANGADINARTDKGSTALSLAKAQAQYLPPSEAQNYNAIVQLLREHGAKE